MATYSDMKARVQRSERAAFVRLERVSKRYLAGREIIALDDVSFEAPAGQLLAVMGPSGSGKSTLLHVLGAMDEPDSGTIHVGDVDVTALVPRQAAAYRRRIGFVFQRFHLLAALSALDNIAAPLMPFRVPFDKFERGRELLAAVGLAGREDSLPSELSGGEQQRVAIARALINSPMLLLADEPTGNLDSENGSQVLDILVELRQREGVTVVIATHEAGIASRCDRVLRLLDGRLVDDLTVTASAGDDALLERVSRFDH